MNQDDYTAFRNGKLTNVRAMQSMITEVGSGLYAYMVMLAIAGRLKESAFYENIRNQVFDIRSKLGEHTTQEGLDDLSNRMRSVYTELETARLFLSAHNKPDEVVILQSVTNTACGLIYTIKHF
jgi:hypothetical protein